MELYRTYLGGEGAINGADFKFSIGRLWIGQSEGWLVHAPAAGGHFVSSDILGVDLQRDTGVVWGGTTTPWSQERHLFNLTVSASSYRFAVYDRGEAVFEQKGPLIGGAIRATVGPP